MRRLALAAALVGLVWLVAPAPAHAQTLDPNRCQNWANGSSGLGGTGSTGGGAGGGGGGSFGPSSPPTTTPALEDGEMGICSSLLDTQAPGTDIGPVPTSHYDIGYDQGGNCVCTSRRVTGWATGVLFGWTTWVVRVGLGLINWALSFHFARLLMGPAQNIATAYEGVVARTGLGHLFLFITVFFGAMLAFAGRMGRGLAEVGGSLLIGAIATTVWTNPSASLQGGLDFTAGVSSEIAAVSVGADPNAATAPVMDPGCHSIGQGGETCGSGAAGPDPQIGASMANAIHKTFVQDPHQIISWGRLIPPGDPCRAVYDAAVASGPWGTSSAPRKEMKAAGCTREDVFNREPSTDRLMAALLVFLAALLVVVMILMVAVGLVTAQLGILIALITWPFASLFGTLPGWGRGVFWSWVGATAMEFTKVLVMMILGLTLVAVSATLAATSSERLVPQMGMVVLVVALGLAQRKRFMAGSRRAVSQFQARMSGGRSSNSDGWVKPALAGVGAGAAFSRAQSALQHHGTNKRSREMVDLQRQRNAALVDGAGGGGGGTTWNTNAWDQRVQNIVVVVNGTNGQQPRYDYDQDDEPVALPA